MNTDRIEKQILLRAPRERVWRALSDSIEFGTWFGMRFNGPFRPGAAMDATIVPTAVDPEVAKHQKPYEGIAFQIVIDKMEPERLFSFRWHPGAVEPGYDYSQEPMTLVAFTLEEVAEGVKLTVTETGFDQIPIARRASAFQSNEGGWTMVITLIDKYLTTYVAAATAR